MKKFYCLFLALLLCLGMCGCQLGNGEPSATDPPETTGGVENPEPAETLPPLAEGEAETVALDKPAFMYVEIIGKMAPNVLVVKLKANEEFGKADETVYVITDKADYWCIGDYPEIKYSKFVRPNDPSKYVRIIADEVFDLPAPEKPIIYLYPESPTVCSVKVNIDGELTCTYPEHGADGWQNFTAYPDGTLIFPGGKEYYALYWEGIQNATFDFSQGFCVRGEDTAAFLEWALAAQGLTRREANEFIVYWLPRMQNNPYNVISFQTTAYTGGAPLDIAPAPDSLLRVFMAYYPTETEVEIQPQSFDGFIRQGFTVVEWGGSQVKEP